MNTVFETTFTVMPADTNYLGNLIFGGAFAAHIDLCAAETVNRLTHDSACDGGITHKMFIEFHKPCYQGDLIFLKGELRSTRSKSVLVKVTAHREKRGIPGRDLVATAYLVFVTISDSTKVQYRPDMLPYAPHGLNYVAKDFSEEEIPHSLFMGK